LNQSIHQAGETAIGPRLVGLAQNAVQLYVFDDRHHDETQDFYFAVDDMEWSCGPWSSDARVLYCHIDREKLAHLIVIGATYLQWQGQPLLTMGGSSAFFEWDQHSTPLSPIPGDLSVTRLFEELATGARPLASNLSQASANGSPSTYAEKH
jgi:hypothetical protein